MEKIKPMGFKPTCREVHRLVSEGLDRDLTLIERTRMRLHLMVCQACTNFSAQMALIRRAMRKLGANDDPGPGGDPK
jgi:predicted anti-sigma-YlaC factor YlaD